MLLPKNLILLSEVNPKNFTCICVDRVVFAPAVVLDV